MTKPVNERLAVVETEVKSIKETVNRVEQNQSVNHEHLSKKIDELTKAVDDKITNHEVRLKQAEETIEPFAKFRRNLWMTIVFSLLGTAFYITVLTKKLEG